MRDLHARANPCNPRFITRKEGKSAVRVRSSALFFTCKSHKIGRLVVDDLLEAGHDVVAYVRNPDKVPQHWPTDRVHIVVGAITDPAAVDDAVHRGQAVISALGPDMSRKATGLPLVEGARLIVTSMQRHQIQRFIGMATPSVLDPRDRRTLQPRPGHSYR